MELITLAFCIRGFAMTFLRSLFLLVLFISLAHCMFIFSFPGGLKLSSR